MLLTNNKRPLFISPRAFEMVKTTIKKPELVKKKQKQICRGAMRIFRRKGFHATTMREIAKATGIGLGNLYDYIQKKEDILFLTYKDMMTQVYQRLDQILDKCQNPLEQIASLIEQRVEIDSKLRKEISFIFTETKYLEKKYLYEMLSLESNFVSKVEAIIDEGISQGVFHCDRPGLLANMVVFNVAILPLRAWNIFPRYTKEETVNELIRFTLRGLGALTPTNCSYESSGIRAHSREKMRRRSQKPRHKTTKAKTHLI